MASVYRNGGLRNTAAGVEGTPLLAGGLAAHVCGAMNPHDALFRSTFASIEVARGHLPRLLPRDLARAIDWSTLRVEPGSFIDEALAETHSDLLYGATMQGEDALVYALFEHQSSFDKWMPLRLLHYVASIWNRWLAELPRAAFAPPVVAIVLHHSEAGWRAAPTLATVFSAGAQALLGPLLPSFTFVLDDISHASAEELAARSGHALAALCMLALSSARDWSKLERAAPYIRATLEVLPGTPAHRDALVRLWRYFFVAAPPDVDRAAVRSILLRVAGPAHAEDLMNAGEQMIHEGWTKGLIEGKRGTLRRFLFVRGIELSEVGAARVEACNDGEQLDDWALRAATATTEADVFAVTR